jgi:N-glycosylase/DNA lyase
MFPSDMIFKGADIKGERIVRDIIQRKFPGLGYKQTSMFMRNVGAAKNLAVIDAHIIWYLKICLNIDSGAITPRKYMYLEDIIHNTTKSLNIDINSFDVILWVLVREFKKNERINSCGMQYVLPLAA